MKIRLVAGATLALFAMSLMTSCTLGDGRDPERPPAAESPDPSPTPTEEPAEEPTVDADPAAARDQAVQACTIVAEKNFVEPGVQDALREASQLAIAASEADPQWEPLAQAVTLLGLAYVLKETNADLMNSALPPAIEECAVVGVTIAG